MVVLLASLDSGPSPLALSSPCTRWSTRRAESDSVYSASPRLDPADQDARCSGRPLASTALFLRLDLARRASGTSSRCVAPFAGPLVPSFTQVRQMLTRCCSSRSAGRARHPSRSFVPLARRLVHPVLEQAPSRPQQHDLLPAPGHRLDHQARAQDAPTFHRARSGIERSPRHFDPVRLPSLLDPRPFLVGSTCYSCRPAELTRSVGVRAVLRGSTAADEPSARRAGRRVARLYTAATSSEAAQATRRAVTAAAAFGVGPGVVDEAVSSVRLSLSLSLFHVLVL